jgi:hypothetical protein
VLLIVVAMLVLVLGLGATLLAGAAVVGGAGLLARRVFRIRRPRAVALPTLDPAREVFAATESGNRRALPPSDRSR